MREPCPCDEDVKQKMHEMSKYLYVHIGSLRNEDERTNKAHVIGFEKNVNHSLRYYS